MTTDQLIAGILEREQGYSDRPSDRGGPTNHGITAATLGKALGMAGPASALAVRNLTVERARDIYLAEYLPPFRSIFFDDLRAQCIDYGVTSGVETSIGALQAVLAVPVDHVLGPQTLAKLSVEPWQLVNNALVAHRVAFFVAIVDNDPTQLENFHGWCRRATSFLVGAV
jgi:type VI secretion system secreted protein VgrG